MLQQKIEQDTGKKVNLEYISNINYKTRSRLNRNDLDLVVKFLKKEGDSSVNIIVDEEENFKGLFYQDVEHVYEVSIQTNFWIHIYLLLVQKAVVEIRIFHIAGFLLGKTLYNISKSEWSKPIYKRIYIQFKTFFNWTWTTLYII